MNAKTKNKTIFILNAKTYMFNGNIIWSNSTANITNGCSWEAKFVTSFVKTFIF